MVNIKKFFKSHYHIDEVMVLTDDKRAEPETNYAPTRKNILMAFRWLRKGAKKGDSLLVHYSGHGSRVKNLDGTEGTYQKRRSKVGEVIICIFMEVHRGYATRAEGRHRNRLTSCSFDRLLMMLL